MNNYINMDFVSKDLIKLDKNLSLLDEFTLDFVNILKKYSDYVLISGYVSILLGRSRMSEDVDLIIPTMSSTDFFVFVDELISKQFYCLNTNDKNEMYDYLNSKTALRFARINEIIPNMEIKFAKNKFDKLALNTKIKVELDELDLFISSLELQIAFKENILKSEKDLEDARHLRIIAKNNLNETLIENYKVMMLE